MLYDVEILNSIKELMIEKDRTISVAESVTSGHLQAALSAATEASMFFQGGITAYNAGQKCRHLNIEPIHALKENSVSEKVACEMAVEVNKMFISTYGIGITGYASTVPEANINELFAYFAIAMGDKVLTSRKISTSKTDPVEVQLDYTVQVLAALVALLKKEQVSHRVRI